MEALNHGMQSGHVHGLDHVFAEPSGGTALHVVFHAVATEGDSLHIANILDA
jgi:hypothetical protein